ncbi:MAG: 3-dehydroquinate synthase [Chitinophagales bacterium]
MERTAARIIYTNELPEVAQYVSDICAEKQYTRVFILMDTHTGKVCYPGIRDSLPPHTCITVPAGEAEKQIHTCTLIWDALAKGKADRKSVLINLGGGVIGDMGGFAASTYMRGIDFIHIPTTLLAQVDASVGGKVAVDMHGLKNLIGVFREPVAVILSAQFLKTLPAEHMRSGFAEMLKHGIIADATLWHQLLQTDPLHTDLLPWIRRSVAIKEEIVQADPTEKGLRKILNYGHSIGHAIETYSLLHDAHPLLHGEAIAIGMICEAWIAGTTGILSLPEMEEIIDALFSIFEKYHFADNAIDEIPDNLKHDKKNAGGHLMFSLPDHIGHCLYDQQVSTEMAMASLTFYAGL